MPLDVHLHDYGIHLHDYGFQSMGTNQLTNAVKRSGKRQETVPFVK